MGFSTGQVGVYYPSDWPGMGSTGTTLGGAIDSGRPALLSLNTGVFATGASSFAGGADHIRYSKLFIRHDGASTNTISNPTIYITNTTFSDQVTVAPDPYYLNTAYGAQTGTSAGRAFIPGGLNTTHFSGYTASTPLRIASLARGDIKLSSGDNIGIWLKLTVPPGLPNSADNTFSIVFLSTVS